MLTLKTLKKEIYSEEDNRPRIADIMMHTAFLYAERSTCGRNQVGCVICKNKRIISTGYNGPLSGDPHCSKGCMEMYTGGCVRSIHAEVNAIMDASRRQIDLEDSILFTTLSPCMKCAEIILLSGISAVIYYEEYRITDSLLYLAEHKVHNEKFAEFKPIKININRYRDKGL